MRIVGGKFRGRSIIAPKTKETRPTMDRTREAVFNMLLNAPWAKKEDGTSILREAVVLDVFAGSGAYGLEALSHGASHVTFIDNNRLATDAIKENIEKIKCTAHTSIIQKKVTSLPTAHQPVDVVFLDPPYHKDLTVGAIETLLKKEWLTDETILVFETESKKPDPLPEKMDILSDRIYGKSRIVIARLIK